MIHRFTFDLTDDDSALSATLVPAASDLNEPNSNALCIASLAPSILSNAFTSYTSLLFPSSRTNDSLPIRICLTTLLQKKFEISHIGFLYTCFPSLVGRKLLVMGTSGLVSTIYRAHLIGHDRSIHGPFRRWWKGKKSRWASPKVEPEADFWYLFGQATSDGQSVAEVYMLSRPLLACIQILATARYQNKNYFIHNLICHGQHMLPT